LRHALAVLALVAGTAGLAGCGGDDSSASGDGKDLPTKTIDVTISADGVTPNGDRVEVQVGQPIELVVKADTEGEIHVHSDPEQELKYGAGTTTIAPFTIDKPGIVEVESHALEKTIVQLEVK
jgi:ABC-type glycerol-3-phosphate transport system substrate-binding protein